MEEEEHRSRVTEDTDRSFILGIYKSIEGWTVEDRIPNNCKTLSESS